MLSILVAHSYFLSFDCKQQARAIEPGLRH